MQSTKMLHYKIMLNITLKIGVTAEYTGSDGRDLFVSARITAIGGNDTSSWVCDKIC